MKALAAGTPLVLLASLLTLAGPRIATAQRPAPADMSVAAHHDDSVRIGCSGGRTGKGSGNTLTRSGELSAYVKPLQADARHTPLRRDRAGAAEVFRELDGVRFRALRFNEIGSMTCVLELNDGKGEHAVTWILGRPPAELAPVLAALRRAFGDDARVWR